MAAPNSSHSWPRPLIVSVSLALVVTALYWARPVLMPVVLAILLTFILSPLVSVLQRRGLGRVPSALLVLLLIVCLVVGIGSAVVLEIRTLANHLPEYQKGLIEKITSLREAGKDSWLDKVVNTFQEISQTVLGMEPKATDKGSAARPAPEFSLMALVQSAASPALEVLLGAGLVFVLLAFMLIQREDLRNRVMRMFGKNLSHMTKALDDASQRVSRFLLIQLMVNLGYGTILGLGLFLIGVPYFVLWGVLAATLRYIPYQGALVAAFFPIAFSLLVLPGWTQPTLVVGLIAILELITSNVIEPRWYGKSIGVSAVAVLIAATFWAWLWGPIGLVLATPLTACLVVLGRYVPALEFFSVLLGDEPVFPTHVTYYQRLLARDQDEAADLVEKYLLDHPAEMVFDEVLVPALLLARKNRLRNELTAEDEEFIFQSMRELVDDLVLPQLPAVQKDHSPDDDSNEQKVLILGCPARDEMDELALQMFGQLLAGVNCRFEVISAQVFSAELVARVKEEQPRLLCVAGLPAEGLIHIRFLCKRLRSQFADLKILVGCWGLATDSQRIEQVRAAGANEVATSLLEMRKQLLPLIQVLSHIKDIKEPLTA
jgi:predicted PurR-regulated permease PerM